MGRCHLLWGCKQGVARTGLWQLHKISIQVQQLQDSRCWDERNELDELSDILKSDQIFSRFRWFLVWKELQILIFLSNGFDPRVWMEPAWCFAVIIHNSLAIVPNTQVSAGFLQCGVLGSPMQRHHIAVLGSFVFELWRSAVDAFEPQDPSWAVRICRRSQSRPKVRPPAGISMMSLIEKKHQH